jgi:hypothetical protein
MGLGMSQMVDELNSRETVTLGALFLAFAKIGLCGISSLLAWTRRVIVDEKHWMEFAETLSVCQFLPGPEISNISIYVGSKFRGPRGAIVALLGLTLAPLAVGLLLGTLYLRYPHLPIIRKILGGLSAACGRAAHCDRDQDAVAASRSSDGAVLRRTRLRRHNLRRITAVGRPPRIGAAQHRGCGR